MIDVKELTKSKIKEIVKIYSEYDKKDAQIIENIYSKFYSKPKSKRNNNIKDYILIKDKEIIGFSGFNKEETETTDIYWLNWTAIKKGYENQNLGSFLIKQIITEIKNRGGRKLYVNTSSKNLKGIKFYENLGFEEEARMKDYYKIGDDSIIFSIII